MQFNVEDHTIFLTLSGSQAYGTNIATSDTDYKGIAIPPKEYFFGSFFVFEQKEELVSKGHPHDKVIYDIRKFATLAADCNPNIIEVLFSSTSDYKVLTRAGERLIEARNFFLSKKAKYTFSGYAHSQLKRIETHRSWLLNPPTEKPKRSDFGLPDEESKVVNSSVMGAVDELSSNGYSFGGEVMTAILKEKQYATALQHWKQYNNWKSERNVDRASLEAKFGYDCYLDDTEFLTADGWRKYDDVADGALLGTLNQRTWRIEYQHFSERVAKPFDGQIAVLHPQHSNCAVTMNHRMLVSPAHRSKANGFSWEFIRECADWTLRPLHELLVSGRSGFHTRLTAEATDVEHPVSDDDLVLLGCYVTEGCVGKRLTDGTASVLRISQKVGGRQQPYMDGLMGRRPDVIHKYTYTHHSDESRAVACDEHVWTIADRDLSRWAEGCCGSGSAAKRLPVWTRDLSKRQVDLLLDVMIAGDGTEREYSRVYYTSSGQLADDLQVMCVSSGRVSQVWGPHSYEAHPEPMYQVYVGARCEAAHVRLAANSPSLDLLEVAGARVVCFTVPNEILVTRRCGKVAIHGNTKHGMHLIRLMRMCVEILGGKGVLVKRPDADELKAIRGGAWSYDKLMEEASTLEAQATSLYETSTLPKSPPIHKISDLCVSVVEDFLRMRT